MSRHEFDANCRGCGPAIINQKTGEVLPDDDPLMKALLNWWKTIDLKTRESYHRFCCLNSKDQEAMEAMMKVHNKVLEVVKEIENHPAN